MSSTPFIYYVYAYVRSVDSPTAKVGTPYYIGKGSGRRAYAKHTTVSVPKDKSKIIIMESNLSEVGALALERRYINWYGRKDNSTGILLNRTDGGEGFSGLVILEETRRKLSFANTGKTASEETKQKMSRSQTGRITSEETKRKLSLANTGRVHSEETKRKMLLTRTNKHGWVQSEETKQKLSLAHTGKGKSEEHIQNMCGPKSEDHKQKMRVPKSKITCPHCGKLGGSNAIKRWHFDNCKNLIDA